jgi:hypothetical protein
LPLLFFGVVVGNRPFGQVAVAHHHLSALLKSSSGKDLAERPKTHAWLGFQFPSPVNSPVPMKVEAI